MKILVAVKRVVDCNIKVHPRADGKDVETTGLKMTMNPFDEIAVEAAVRLKEEGKATEVVAVSVGPAKASDTLRTAMAIGADRAVHVLLDATVEPFTIAKILASVAKKETPDLILMGKQAVDNDANQVPQMLSALLSVPVATHVSKLALDGTTLQVTSETDDGLVTLKGELPAVVSADLRLAEPRYVTLPSMMRAKKKPIETLAADSLGVDLTRKTAILEITEPKKARAAEKLANVDELISRLVADKKLTKEEA